MNAVREYLSKQVRVIRNRHKANNDGYVSVSDFVLQNGRPFIHSPLPSHIRTMRKKQCFANAQQLVLSDNDLIYCEGYATSSALRLGDLDFISFPLLHGWCVTYDGTVIDPTWSGRRSRPEGIDYFGVAINLNYVLGSILTDNTHHPIIDNFKYRWPIFSSPVEHWRHPVNDL